jgi:hypothetical protein
VVGEGIYWWGSSQPGQLDFSIAHTRRGTLDSVTASDLVILTCHNMVNMCYVLIYEFLVVIEGCWLIQLNIPSVIEIPFAMLG